MHGGRGGGQGVGVGDGRGRGGVVAGGGDDGGHGGAVRVLLLHRRGRRGVGRQHGGRGMVHVLLLEGAGSLRLLRRGVARAGGGGGGGGDGGASVRHGHWAQEVGVSLGGGGGGGHGRDAAAGRGGDGGGGGGRVLRGVASVRHGVNLDGEVLDEGEGEAALVAHQADGGLVHHVVQDHEVLVLEAVVGALEVVVQVVLQLGLLRPHVREVNEEPGAHVPLHVLDLLRPGRAVPAAEQVAVLEQAAPADLLRAPRGDQLLVQVVERLAKVPVHALAHHGGEEVVPDGRLGLGATVVEEEERVEEDVEGVDRELVLPPHGVHELELDAFGAVVAQGDERPAVGVVVDLDHLGDVGLLHGAGGHALAGDALRKKLHQGLEHSALDAVVGAPRRKVHGEDEVEVVVGDVAVVGLRVALGGRGGRRRGRGGRGYKVGGQDGGCSGPVESDLGHLDPVLVLQAAPDHADEVAQLDLDGGEVAAAVDEDDIAHQVVQPTDLLEKRRKLLVSVKSNQGRQSSDAPTIILLNLLCSKQQHLCKKQLRS